MNPTTNTVNDPLIGATVLDRYVITSLLRTEPRGTSYLADPSRGGDPVVVKVLVGGVPSHGARATWSNALNQAEKLVRLDHPNIERMIECGHTRVTGEPLFCCVTERVEGDSLHHRVRESGPLTIAEAVTVGQQVARGLAAVHRIGLVHGDLRATNVMLRRAASNDGSDDRVVLCDVGLTTLLLRSLGTSPSLREMMCAPESIAPEQIRGEATSIATDIYAFGALFFRMLTGHAPFHADNNSQMLRAHLSSPVPTMRERGAAADLPSSLDALIRQCMAKRPDDRPSSIDALLAGLQECEATVLSINASRTPSWVVPAMPSSTGIHSTAPPSGGLVSAPPRRPSPPTPPPVEPNPEDIRRDSGPEALDLGERATAMPDVSSTAEAEAPQTVFETYTDPNDPAECATQVPPVPTEPLPRHWFRVAAALTLFCGVSAGYVISPTLSPRRRPAVIAEAAPEPAVSVATPRRAVAPIAVASTPTPTPSVVRVEVRSNAHGAAAIIRGRTYPVPFEIEIAPGTDPEMVEVSAIGFHTRRAWMVLDRTLRVQLDLDQERENPVAVRDTAPPPRVVAAPRVFRGVQVLPAALASTAPRAPARPRLTPTATPIRPASHTTPVPLGYGQIATVVREHEAAVHKCIEDARSNGTDVTGRIPITITVDGRGIVRHAAWVGNDVAHRAAARCIVGEVQRWNFPATGAEDETQVVYSFGAR